MTTPAPKKQGCQLFGIPIIPPTPGMMLSTAVTLSIAGALFPLIFPDQKSVGDLEQFLALSLGLNLVKDCCNFEGKPWLVQVPFILGASAAVWPFVHLCAVLSTQLSL